MQQFSVVQSSATIFSSPASSVIQQNSHIVRSSKSQATIYWFVLHGLQGQGAYSSSGHCLSEPQTLQMTTEPKSLDQSLSKCQGPTTLPSIKLAPGFPVIKIILLEWLGLWIFNS